MHKERLTPPTPDERTLRRQLAALERFYETNEAHVVWGMILTLRYILGDGGELVSDLAQCQERTEQELARLADESQFVHQRFMRPV